jgi:hypothetical protein
MATKDNRCWPGYEPVKGKKAHSQGSCRPEADSKLAPSEKEFRGKRKRQLDQWATEHPKSPKSAAQHLAAPSKRVVKKKATKKGAPKKSAPRK